MNDIAEFDVRVRDEIRTKLLAFAEPISLGAPGLARAIEASLPRNPKICSRTLARFLKKERETNLQALAYYKQFADTLPKADPIGDMGAALAAIHKGNDIEFADGTHTLAVSYKNHFRSSYLSSLEITSSKNFARLTQRESEGKSLREGVLIYHDKTFDITLVDRVTRSTAHYFISDRSLQGHGVEIAVAPGAHSPLKLVSLKLNPSSRLKAFLNAISISQLDFALEFSFEEPEEFIKALFKRILIRLKNEFIVLLKWLVNSKMLRKVSGFCSSVFSLHSKFSILTLTTNELSRRFIRAVDQADLEETRRYLEQGADINFTESGTGMTALHFAIGRNSYEIVHLLIERSATFKPDRFGRMPSFIAIECEVDEQLLDYVVDSEMAALMDDV